MKLNRYVSNDDSGKQVTAASMKEATVLLPGAKLSLKYHVVVEVDTDSSDMADELHDTDRFLVVQHRQAYIKPKNPALVKDPEKYFLFPVNAYVHGDVSLRLTVDDKSPCRFDTAVGCGYVALSKADHDLPPEKLLEVARKFLQACQEEYFGTKYGCRVWDANREQVDSCYGFHSEEAALEWAKSEGYL